MNNQQERYWQVHKSVATETRKYLKLVYFS